MMRRHTAVRDSVLRLCAIPKAFTLKLAGGFSGATEPDFVFRYSSRELQISQNKTRQVPKWFVKVRVVSKNGWNHLNIFRWSVPDFGVQHRRVIWLTVFYLYRTAESEHVVSINPALY